VPPNPEDVMEQFHMSIVKDIDQVVSNAVEKQLEKTVRAK
jgi:hypothetical protein